MSAPRKALMLSVGLVDRVRAEADRRVLGPTLLAERILSEALDRLEADPLDQWGRPRQQHDHDLGRVLTTDPLTGSTPIR